MSSNSTSSSPVSPTGLHIDNFKKAKYTSRYATTQLCGDLNNTKKHFASLKKKGNKMKCEVCGEMTTIRCGLCNKYMRLYNKKKFVGGQCALTYHEGSFFGLPKRDSEKLFGIPKSEWLSSSTNKIKCNARRIETIKEAIWEQGGHM